MELEKYRDVQLSEKVNEFVGFYTREFYCLDNFSAFKVKYKGKTFSTMEHAYQYLKFEKTDKKISDRIFNSYSPYEAQKIAHGNKDKADPKFAKNKVVIMERLLRLKLKQKEENIREHDKIRELFRILKIDVEYYSNFYNPVNLPQLFYYHVFLRMNTFLQRVHLSLV